MALSTIDQHLPSAYTRCKICGERVLAGMASAHMLDQHHDLAMLLVLPMVPPLPGPLEITATTIEKLVADGLAEMRDGVAHRTEAGDAALKKAGLRAF